MNPSRLLTLKKRSDFQRVASVGYKHITRFFVLQAAPQVPLSPEGAEKERPALELRFGFIITRKMGCAVQRNRIRRRFKAALQEILQTTQPPKVSLNIVIIARSSTLAAPFDALKEALQEALNRVFKSL